MFLSLFYKVGREGTAPNSFYKGQCYPNTKCRKGWNKGSYRSILQWIQTDRQTHTAHIHTHLWNFYKPNSRIRQKGAPWPGWFHSRDTCLVQNVQINVLHQNIHADLRVEIIHNQWTYTGLMAEIMWSFQPMQKELWQGSLKKPLGERRYPNIIKAVTTKLQPTLR